MFILWKASQTLGSLSSQSPQYPEPFFSAINSVPPMPWSLPYGEINMSQLPYIRELICRWFCAFNDTELP